MGVDSVDYLFLYFRKNIYRLLALIYH